jgi:dTDP-4-dehydrorhamnose reductase
VEKKEETKAGKVLVTGSSGQLGYELMKRCPAGTECRGVDLPEVDITSREQVLGLCGEFRPDVLINAAAYTAVDRAESEEEAARRVNVEGAENAASACRLLGCRLIHISTDFVFDGASRRPYRITDQPAPLGVYGKTKLLGEKAVLKELPGAAVVRTSWLYSSHGGNFVKTMLRLMGETEELRVVCDQVGSPTWAGGLAAALWLLVKRPEEKGIFHWSDLGVASWYDFAVAVYEEALLLGILRHGVQVIPVPSEAYPTQARRPSYSVMDTARIRDALGISGVHWRENLRTMLREMHKN